MTAQTLATTEIKVTPDPGPVFPKFLTPSLDPGPKEKRRTLAESTPVNRILSHLWIPANSAARANHTKAQNTWSTLIFSFKHAHICINTNAKMCLKPFIQRNSMTSSKKFTFDLCWTDFLSFALIISSDQSQSKA